MISNLLARLRQPSFTSAMPAPLEYWRNDLAVVLVVALALLLGLGLRNLALNATDSVELGEGLPTLRYPANWRTLQPEGLRFQATEPASASSFDTQIDMAVRELKPGETLDQARATRALQRSRDLSHYREFSAAPATVLAGEAALVTTYAYVADPTRDSGGSGLPVVVQGQDILFLQGTKLVVVTLTADATVWRQETGHFQLVTDSLNLTLTDASPQTMTGGEQ
jgi:hypothetical protein